MTDIDGQLRIAIQRLLSHGSIDGADTTPTPADWTVEKEELFLKCSAHARDCRKRKSQTLADKLRALLRGIRATDPRQAEYIKWVLELPGKHLPTEEDRSSFNSMFNRLLRDECVDPALRQSMRESVEKFGSLSAAFFPLIGQQVQTQHGRGRLLAVSASQCEIEQGGAGQIYRVLPSEIYLDGSTSTKRSESPLTLKLKEKCHGFSSKR
jgi:hypothetical protein